MCEFNASVINRQTTGPLAHQCQRLGQRRSQRLRGARRQRFGRIIDRPDSGRGDPGQAG